MNVAVIEPSTLLSRKETAARLGIAMVTLDSWRRLDRGPAPTILGSRVLYSDAEIERFVREKTAQRSLAMTHLADLIQDELAERVSRISPPIPMSVVSEALAVTANLAASIRMFDARLREREFTTNDAEGFVSAANSLMNCLHGLGGTAVIAQSLAEDIAAGAMATTGQLFPELLPDEFA